MSDQIMYDTMSEGIFFLIIYYGFIRPGVRLIVYASSLMPGTEYNRSSRSICARSSEYRPERGLPIRSGKYCIISDPRAGPAGHESGRRASTCTFAQSKDGSAGQIRESDPRVSRKQLAGYGAVNCPTSRLGIYILLARY